MDRGVTLLAADQLLVLEVPLVAVETCLRLVVRLNINGLGLASFCPLLPASGPPVQQRLSLLLRTGRAPSSTLLTATGGRNMVGWVKDLPGPLRRKSLCLHYFYKMLDYLFSSTAGGKFRVLILIISYITCLLRGLQIFFISLPLFLR